MGRILKATLIYVNNEADDTKTLEKTIEADINVFRDYIGGALAFDFKSIEIEEYKELNNTNDTKS